VETNIISMDQEFFNQVKASIKEALEMDKNPSLIHAFLGYIYGIYDMQKMSLQQYEELVLYIETFGPIDDNVRMTLIVGKDL
jgi:hypothetical protein